MGRTTLVLLVLAAAVVGVLLLTVPEAPDEESSETNAENENLEHELEELNFERTLEGDRRWQLESPSARRLEDGYRLSEPRIRLVEDTGEIMNARAREAWYDEEAQTLRTEGEVEILRPEDEQLFCTEVLNWNLEEDTVHTERPVKMVEPTRRLTSTGMSGNLSLERVQFLSDVQLRSGSFALRCSWSDWPAN